MTMMRCIAFLLFNSVYATIFGQTADLDIFKITYYDQMSVNKIQYDTILVDGICDFDFYREHFNIPYHYPKVFIDSSYGNQTIIVWDDSLKEKQFSSNWTYNFTYDSLSRVTGYAYSGCTLCSQMPYYMRISYDEFNRPVKFEYWMRFESVTSDSPMEVFEFYYGVNGDIIRLLHINPGQFDEQVEKL